MTPQQVLNDAIASFGQFSGRIAQVEDDFWDVLWEVESILKPTECLQSATLTVNYADPRFGTATLPAEAFDVKSVVRPTDWVHLQRVSSFDYIKTFPSWIPPAVAYAFDPVNKLLYVNNGLGSPPAQLEVGYFVHTARSPVTQDLPVLDRLYPVIRVGLMAKLARKVKDAERMQVFEKEYIQLLGGQP